MDLRDRGSIHMATYVQQPMVDLRGRGSIQYTHGHVGPSASGGQGPIPPRHFHIGASQSYVYLHLIVYLVVHLSDLVSMHGMNARQIRVFVMH